MKRITDLHVCIVSSSFPLHEGHVQSPFLLYLTRALAARNVHVTVICPFVKGSRPASTIGSVRVHRFHYFWPRRLQTLTDKGGIPSQLKGSLFAKIQLAALTLAEFFAVWKFVRRNRCDLLHAQWSLPGFVSVLVKKLTGVPVLLTERGAALQIAVRHALLKPTLRYSLKHSDFVTTNNFAQATIIKELGVRGENVRVVVNGIDQSLFLPLDKQLCRRKLGLTEHRPILLFVGWLIERKGVKYLLQAVARLVRQHPKLRLVIIGDGILRCSLEQLTQDLKMRSRVFFVGSLSHRDVAQYMNAADLLVLPSLSEGRANVLLEALACKTPVVATDVGDASSVVVDQVSGFLCKPKNAQDLYVAMERALNSSFRKRFSQNIGKIQKEKLISWDACAQHYIKIYQQILEREGKKIY